MMLQKLKQRCMIKAWNLDYPSDRFGVKVEQGRLLIQGWVVLHSWAWLLTHASRPYITFPINDQSELRFPLQVDRPDVIEAVFELDDEKVCLSHPQLACGFRFYVESKSRPLLLKLVAGGQRLNLAQLYPDDFLPEPLFLQESQPLKVLQGKSGWLFLDNDTNHSVDQFTGQVFLTPAGERAWLDYAAQLGQSRPCLKMPAQLLIAPAKESVMGAYHPCNEGDEGFLDRVLELLPEGQVVYPKEQLKMLGDEAFYKTDTHWTHKGALQAALMLAQRLGVDESLLRKLEGAFRFKTKSHAGDLGNKLAPPVAAEAPVLVSGSYRSSVVYDNGLPNFGRILLLKNDKPLLKSRCLVFGSSSSYSMFQMLQKLFAEVVFVHTAGNLDESFIDAVQPDYLVAQTNARFMVRAPIDKSDVLNVIEDKLGGLTDEEVQRMRKNQLLKPPAEAMVKRIAAWHAPVVSYLDQRD